jgi:predicted short-subunit dehydrogenase-like oxidoreductase (DUF2520 family)
MDIVIIGSGNVATVLGRKSQAAGHRIIQVYSPNGAHANTLASRLGTNSTAYISTVEKTADLMIIALRDEAIAAFIKNLGITKSILTHTAGSLPIEILSGASGHYGVLYPLQSLRKEIDRLPALTMLVDGNEEGTKTQIRKFASTIAETVLPADNLTRLKYHLAGTIVNNFTNQLFTTAEVFCKNENISFAVLQPLMEETVMRLRKTDPSQAQTGPALRNDQITIQKHRELLKNYPGIIKFYDLFTAEIQRFATGDTL